MDITSHANTLGQAQTVTCLELGKWLPLLLGRAPWRCPGFPEELWP